MPEKCPSTYRIDYKDKTRLRCDKQQDHQFHHGAFYRNVRFYWKTAEQDPTTKENV